MRLVWVAQEHWVMPDRVEDDESSHDDDDDNDKDGQREYKILFKHANLIFSHLYYKYQDSFQFD